MNISRDQFKSATEKHGVEPEISEQIWLELETEQTPQAFNFENVAFYFGTLIIMGAMGWYMSRAWDDFNPIQLSILGCVYAIILSAIGYNLWFKRQLTIPGGLLFTAAVWMVPVIVFGIEKATGFWPQDSQGSYHEYHALIKGSWIIMEICTVIVGLIVIRMIPFSFLTFPVAYALWYMSMDLAPIIYGRELHSHDREIVSIVCGLIMILIAYITDRRTKQDYSFWMYLFGLMAFWGGLTSMHSDGEWNKAIYCAINIFLLFVSVVLQRQTFAVFGAMGISVYLGHLAYDIFKDSLMFTIILSIIGLGIIFLGIAYKRNKTKIEEAVNSALPPFILKLNPALRGR